jgi:hypothetical protein
MDGYNGWANYETWAISLMLNNSYITYTAMYDFMGRWEESAHGSPYMAFIRYRGMSSWRVGARDADRFTFATRKANRHELDEMMREIHGGHPLKPMQVGTCVYPVKAGV